MITRVRYFAGQILGVAELETEQRYVIERLRRRNRWLHGWGIVAGLRLSIGPKEIGVAPGFALDCLGNEIEIEEPTGWPLRGAGRGTACYLTLAFAERAVDPGPVLGEPSNGGDEPAAYTRVEESWALAYAVGRSPVTGRTGSRSPGSCAQGLAGGWTRATGRVACGRSAGLRHPRACRFSNSTRNASRLGSPRPRQPFRPERDT